MATTIYSGNKVTLANTTEVDLEFGDLVDSQAKETLLYIRVDADNSGTIQFAAGRAITDDDQPFAAGITVPITVRDGFRNLRAKASAGGQSFCVTH